MEKRASAQVAFVLSVTRAHCWLALLKEREERLEITAHVMRIDIARICEAQARGEG